MMPLLGLDFILSVSLSCLTECSPWASPRVAKAEASVKIFEENSTEKERVGWNYLFIFGVGTNAS